MPEGDTIFRVATVLRRVLAGATVTAAAAHARTTVDAASLVGHVVTGVEANGKNVLVRFDDGRVLHTHLRMEGSWHVYRKGERWKMPAHDARVVLTTHEWEAVCFRAPVVSLLTADGERRSPALSRLGPDLARDDFDAVAARSRLRALGELPIGDAVMRQDALAGVGNVYKSEVLYVTRVDPLVPVSTLDDATLDRIVATARALLRRNLGGRGRVTTPPALARRPAVWVYRREGEPCFTCETPIAMRRQGTLARSTYYCPKCQAVSPASGRASGSPRRRGRP